MDVFDYIELFYNPIRRHGSAGDLSPVDHGSELAG
jgi:putative transposase